MEFWIIVPSGNIRNPYERDTCFTTTWHRIVFLLNFKVHVLTDRPIAQLQSRNAQKYDIVISSAHEKPVSHNNPCCS